ncbi:MAG TPA: RNA methyltransferase [Candidatus Paceibacterota bacterium]
MVAILNNLRSLHNVGSIFRTADALGIEKLYLCGITPSPIDRFGKIRQQLAKVSLGAEKYVPWEKAGSALTVIKSLKNEGYKIFSIEQSKNSIPYYKFQRSKIHDSRFALVVGNEIRGLPKTILAASDKILEIPMHGQKESLNVGVAFAIVAFHIRNNY